MSDTVAARVRRVEPAAVGAALTSAVEAERLRIVAGLIRVTGDWELAEDCVQDAAERAMARWPNDGIPDNPSAWLTTTAHRRAVDVLRRRRTETAKLREVQAMAERSTGSASTGETPRDEPAMDDRLVLLFTCCHPALPLAGQVALTCKTVAGLSTRQVARAFLVSEATMGQRLLRARNKIAHAGIGFTAPEPRRLGERVAGVLTVIYLLFNEGYAASEGGAADDPTLAREAIELAGLVARLLPGDDEARSLLALLLLQHSRRAARVDATGDLIPMAEQDRTLWDTQLIEAGRAALETARSGGRPAGPYRLQAEIAALHSAATEPGGTDWAGIVEQYDRLLAIQPSPVVELNRAVALGFRDGPTAGLEAVDRVARDPRLADYHLVPAARADLLRRAGRIGEAGAEYRRAFAGARTDAERRFLARRLAELEG